MALTAGRKLEFVGSQQEISPKLAASDTYFLGALLCYDANGYAAVPTDIAASFPAGIVKGYYEGGGGGDDAFVVAASTFPRAVLERGRVWLPFSGAAQADVGEIFYMADDGTLTQTAGSKTVGLVALDFKTGVLLFDLTAPDRIA
jgi:hypothetical protein